MKLLAKTNLYYIFFSIITFAIVTGSFYVVVEYLIYKEVDQRLEVERKDFENFIKTHGYWDESCYFVEDKIELEAVAREFAMAPYFHDTLLFNRYSDLAVPFREYRFVNKLGDNAYIVSIRKSLIESNQLLKFTTTVMLIALSVGLLLLYWFQARISQKIWRPFYDTLSKAKSFDVNEGKGLTLSREDIHEFTELNSSLTKMTAKIADDYRNLKEFTENASHEIQTPLALINSRVEGLIQAKDMSNENMHWIQDIHESTMRLSRLNQALLLLAKIENGQFHDKEEVNVTAIVENRLTEMEEIFSHKSITVENRITDAFKFAAHPALAEILVTNLLSNAVKHNLAHNGRLIIESTSGSLVISNTGPSLSVPPNELFERFKKQNPASGSLGLGLAIVKKICTLYKLDINYEAKDGLHSIRIQSLEN
ncbi:MAG TPA: HAMP domain-containing sensor histidine kinase [Cyclobacteriaceae bacterium]|nr:HAMP domain-containing sensor histidine kinase [Cyclobacteriaceae bacterium]